jgi:hypothetical protein
MGWKNQGIVLRFQAGDSIQTGCAAQTAWMQEALSPEVKRLWRETKPLTTS